MTAAGGVSGQGRRRARPQGGGGSVIEFKTNNQYPSKVRLAGLALLHSVAP